ncbi:hypothetical protein BGZ63DRAFT_148780 [Mariannaea sp. PMI_226]|nr:hypothetical protein BGZ63DRAFT_148780 [Mariannaea sp. PMI_226]
MPSESPVHLIPWDPDCDDHHKIMTQQRCECGWDYDKLDSWKETQKSGQKCLFWITILDSDIESEQSRDLFSLLPKDAKTLRDTDLHLRGTLRTPSQQLFYPIGHISLDAYNPGADKVGVKIEDRRVYWIKTFYIQHVFRSKGIGRAAMDIVESMAVAEPLCAETLGLDTTSTEDAIMMEIAKTGKPPKMTNQEWYTRRGYEWIGTYQNLYHPPPPGEVWPDFKAVFMKKDIV